MIGLTEVQINDLRVLQQLCDEFKTELVIIGAVAYQYNFPNQERHTNDIDLAVALDLNDFGKFEKGLLAARWSQVHKREHRWHSPQGTLFDLIPAGENLRNAKHLTWPKSQLKMSLVGFDHVFSESQPVEIGDRLIIRIISAPVLMLLKIVAFMDDHVTREKDLYDIRAMLGLYHADSDRIFSEWVLNSGLPDISLASAFLMGVDLRSLCTLDELASIRQFLTLVSDEGKPAHQVFLRAGRIYSARQENAARAEIMAFVKGLSTVIAFATLDVVPGIAVTDRVQTSVFESLTRMAKEGAIVRVTPGVPTPRLDFQIARIDLERDVVVVEQLGTGRVVHLPLNQIEAVLHLGPGSRDLIQLKGRLQWMTLSARGEGWEVRPEKPDSELGIAKRSPEQDPRPAEIQRELYLKGYSVGWANEDQVTAAHGAKREIIYDTDGCYLRKRDRPFDQILVRFRR